MSIDTIKIQYWEQIESRDVILPHNSRPELFFEVFLVRIHMKFQDMLDGNSFRLYWMPSNFVSVDERRRVSSMAELEEFARLFVEGIKTSVGAPSLFIFKDDTSPTKVPETKRKRSDNASVQSKVSRSTEASNSVRYRDENSCVFCGYADNAKRDTCHIFEISQYNAYNGDKKQMLLELGLDYINTMANMLALCVCCHREFDNRFIGIHPSARTLVISDAIRSKNTQGNIPFSQLHGKVLTLKLHARHHPTEELLKYRYDEFERTLRTTSNYTTIYCIKCLEVFDSQNDLSHHFDLSHE